MKLSFRNASLVFVGCVCCASAIWIPFFACNELMVCGDGLNAASIPMLVSVAVLVIGIFLLMNYGKTGA